MTFLKKHWWKFAGGVVGFFVLIILIGIFSDSEGDTGTDDAGRMDITKTELVDLLTQKDLFSCTLPMESRNDKNEFGVRCDSNDDGAFSILMTGKENEVRSILYVANIVEPRNKAALEMASISMFHRISPLIFEECFGPDDCGWWFKNAFKDSGRTGEDIHTSMQGIAVTVRTDVEDDIAYEVLMNGALKNTDISEYQDRYSCERLGERAIEMSEEDEEMTPMLKIYNLEYTIEYDLDMHITRVSRHASGWKVRDPMRISECTGEALFERGRTRGIIVYVEEYMDGDIFTGYRLR